MFGGERDRLKAEIEALKKEIANDKIEAAKDKKRIAELEEVDHEKINAHLDGRISDLEESRNTAFDIFYAIKDTLKELDVEIVRNMEDKLDKMRKDRKDREKKEREAWINRRR